MTLKHHLPVLEINNKHQHTVVKPVLRGHLWDKEKVALKDRWPLKRGSIHMKFSMTWQDKGELLIQVTA
jgi:hypothetical protein